MQTTILDLGVSIGMSSLPEETLSLRPYLDYLKETEEASDSLKAQFLNYIINKFDENPQLSKPVSVNDIKEYDSVLRLIDASLSPMLAGDPLHFRAFSMPLSPVAFYSSEAFMNLVCDNPATGCMKRNMPAKSPEAHLKKMKEFSYSLIWQKYYQLHCPFHPEMIYPSKDEVTQLERYYRISFDNRFIQIHAEEPPTLSKADIETISLKYPEKEELLAYLEANMPLSTFHFEGFRILHVEDITTSHAIERIKNKLIDTTTQTNTAVFEDIAHELQKLVEQNDIEFGLLPVYELNGKYVFDEPAITDHNAMPAHDKKMETSMCNFFTKMYLQRPKRILVKDINEESATKHEYLRSLKDMGIKSYALLPVSFNNKLSGILEIYTNKENQLNNNTLTKLEPAMPFLAQLMQQNIDAFNNRLEKVIKENFTSVQPSVQWKFNEAAWHYVQNEDEDAAHVEIEDIYFEKVFPLYGAVDIRNSTIQRNAALQKDLNVQFSLLIRVLLEMKELSGFGLIDEKIFTAKGWLDKINAPEGFYEETELNDYLDREINYFLKEFSEGTPALKSLADEYYTALNEDKGIATEYRRNLEVSMITMVSAINKLVDEMKNEAQQAYPSFFEKFRTDGVEYDIYIGQSITPEKPFSEIYLRNLRLLQLRSMARIARKTHSIRNAMPEPLESTQLIFIHAHPIDIKFRKDERRFDVEGSYNIRYHVVKKRIDKVLIKGTSNRLTIPGKIAMVYFNQKEADEFVSHIAYLQKENILNDDLEYLELEQVQGVQGLKALRVGVSVDEVKN